MAEGAPVAGPSLRLVLLGRMEAWSLGSVPVLPRSRRARGLLALLAMAPVGTPVPRTRLGALLWSRRGEDQQRGSLRQALHELRTALEPVGTSVLEATRDTVGLRAEEVWVDAIEMAQAPQDPQRRHRLEAPEEGLEEAFLSDLEGLDPAFDLWLAGQRRRLRATLRDAVPQAPERAPGEGGAGAAEIAETPGPAAPDRGPGEGTGQGQEPAQEGEAAMPRSPSAAPRAAPGAGGQPGSPPPRPAPTRMAHRGARLGVLPFRLLGGTPAEEHLPIALAEEITAALARFRWLFVVDHTSLASAVDRSDEATVAHDLGLDALLSGHVQRSTDGSRIRFSFHLTDLRAAPPSVAWSGRFDRAADDLLALQDEVAAEVVAQIDPEILMIEARRAAARTGGPAHASAYELLLRAIPATHRLDRDAFLAAGNLLRQAITQEPDYAAPHAWLAYWNLFRVGQGWAEDSGELMSETERLAARAVALDPLDAQALTILGHTRAFLRHRPEEALALHDRALALNPNLAMAWVFSGMAQSYLGNHAGALGRLERYRQLAPCHPHAFFFDAARGIPLLFLRRHEEAAAVGRAVTALQPGFSYPYKTYLAALGHLGLAEEAAEVRERLLAIEPDFTVAKGLRRTPVRRAEDRAHYAEGLRKAGLS